MVDLKHIFPYLDSKHKRKGRLYRSGKPIPDTIVDEKKKNGKDNEKKEIPLFYTHKIRVPKYEYF